MNNDEGLIRDLFEYAEQKETLRMSAPITVILWQDKNQSNQLLALAFALSSVLEKHPNIDKAINMVTATTRALIKDTRKNG